MRVVHISLAPVAGAPIKVVKALRTYGGIHARLVNLDPNFYRGRTFPEDLCWPQDKDTIYAEIQSADIIHLHQSVLLEEPTLQLNFKDKLRFPKTHFIREWHSEPGLFKRFNRTDLDGFDDETFPLLVMAQYHERYYPQGIPVPLLTNVEDFADIPLAMPFPPLVAYSPSTRLPLQKWRWTSKGYEETMMVLRDLQKEYTFDIDVIENVPWQEAVERKKRATFVIDDLVTGSFHTSGLEGLALGKPTFAYLDSRTVATLATLTGSNALPFINCNINNFPAIFRRLLQDAALCNSIGQYSKQWMYRYYHEKKLIRHYIAIYEKLLDGTLPPRHAVQRTPGENFFATELYDLHFQILHGLG